MDESGQLSAEWAAVYEQSSQRLTRLAVLLVGHADAHDLLTEAVWRAQLAVVFLHYRDDLTLERAAAELGIGIGIGPARSHLDRVKRRLRPLLPNFETEHKR